MILGHHIDNDYAPPYLHDALFFTLLYIQTNQNLHIRHMNLFFYNIVDNMYKFKITHAGKVERSNNNVKIAKNPMSFK